MRKTFFFLMILPVISIGQTLKLSTGATASTLIYPAETGIKTGFNNILTGFTGTVGVDYLETKWGFLSSNIGFVQKGRKDKVTYTDALGNNTWVGTFKSKFNYVTFNTTMNFKLSQSSLVPFFSIGPRVDYLLNQSHFYDPGNIKFAYGLNGGFGIIKRTGKMEFGGRVDYLLNIAERPDDRTGAVQVFFGYKLK
jgi:hypothetical protein